MLWTRDPVGEASGLAQESVVWSTVLDGGLKKELVGTESEPESLQEIPIVLNELQDFSYSLTREIHPLRSPSELVVHGATNPQRPQSLIEMATDIRWPPGKRAPQGLS